MASQKEKEENWLAEYEDDIGDEARELAHHSWEAVCESRYKSGVQRNHHLRHSLAQSPYASITHPHPHPHPHCPLPSASITITITVSTDLHLHRPMLPSPSLSLPFPTAVA